jgi:hypothetical protein
MGIPPGPSEGSEVHRALPLVLSRGLSRHTTASTPPGNIFYIAPGHDSWVVGDEPYVSLHFLGADQYADRH